MAAADAAVAAGKPYVVVQVSTQRSQHGCSNTTLAARDGPRGHLRAATAPDLSSSDAEEQHRFNCS